MLVPYKGRQYSTYEDSELDEFPRGRSYGQSAATDFRGYDRQEFQLQQSGNKLQRLGLERISPTFGSNSRQIRYSSTRENLMPPRQYRSASSMGREIVPAAIFPPSPNPLRTLSTPDKFSPSMTLENKPSSSFTWWISTKEQSYVSANMFEDVKKILKRGERMYTVKEKHVGRDRTQLSVEEGDYLMRMDGPDVRYTMVMNQYGETGLVPRGNLWEIKRPKKVKKKHSKKVKNASPESSSDSSSPEPTPTTMTAPHTPPRNYVMAPTSMMPQFQPIQYIPYGGYQPPTPQIYIMR